MAKRRLRIVKTTPNLGAVCERCGMGFDSVLPDRSAAEAEIYAAFDAHICLPLDASQNAVRIIREATENK